MSREVDHAGVMLRRLAGIATGALSIRQVQQYADQWTDLHSRVNLATGSQEKGAAVMERRASMARRTYSGLGQTAESWLANATALRELGMSTRESLDFTEALNNAMVVSGAKAERAASVQNALSKAMALGKLSGDNLNTVIQTGGRVAELLAAALGTTVSGLRAMGQQGAITGDVIRTALVGNLEGLREEADSMPATISDAFTLIGNAALQLVGTWDQLSGASSMIAGALIMVADNLDRLSAIGIAFAGFDALDLGRIDNPFEGAAADAGRAAADAFGAAFSRSYIEAPDLFGDLAGEAGSAARAQLEAAGQLADAVTRPLESWQALSDAMVNTGVDGKDALDDATAAAGRVTDTLDGAGAAAGRAGTATKQAGKDAKDGAEVAKIGWDAVTASLADYAGKAREIGADIGTALVGAFQSAENAVGEFVKTGKLNFRDLMTSLLADLAKLGARKFLLGPLAGALGNALGGMGGGSIFANILHAGGMVGAAEPGRMVPAAAFANAPRMHSGGWAGLRSDEIPAILQKGERVRVGQDVPFRVQTALRAPDQPPAPPF